MGAPELPNDTGDDHLHTSHIIQHPPALSDESDNESLLDGGAYDGYQPLAMDEHSDYGHLQINVGDDNNSYYNRDGLNRIQENRILAENEPVEADPNIPHIERADLEIEREIWNQPRPRELQIELDGNKTQQILSAMANFQLPNLSVPAWAAGVPEERWKEELLQRIRQRDIPDDNPKVEGREGST